MTRAILELVPWYNVLGTPLFTLRLLARNLGIS